MTSPNRPPLWEVVDAAWWSLVNTEEPHCDPPASDQSACVIRAMRDWLVPEESIEDAPGRFVNGCCMEERQRLRALLTTEADRAERGDG